MLKELVKSYNNIFSKKTKQVTKSNKSYVVEYDLKNHSSKECKAVKYTVKNLSSNPKEAIYEILYNI